MPFLHIVILALVQGITEFLPVSSSAHLVLTHALLGSDGTHEDAMMDIAVHVGTLVAVLIGFRRDVWAMIRAACAICRKTGAEGKRTLVYVLVASVPVMAAGLLMHVYQPAWGRSILLMGWFSILFGIVLWYADKFRPAARTVENMTLKDAVFIGLAQAVALLPGVSRSGITMTAGRWSGLTRTESARFSLLLAIVAISGAGTLGGLSLLESKDAALGFDALLAAAMSFFSSWAALILMMKWLQHATFTPFVIYRIFLGVAILAFYYAGFL